MSPATTNELLVPRLFIDADVLFAGAASSSEHGASLLVLRLAELTLIEAITSEQVIGEVSRNLQRKVPPAVALFHQLVAHCLLVVADPDRLWLGKVTGLADPKDAPLLAVALREGCPWLVTFNLRDYHPGHRDVKVLRPGDFVDLLRRRLSRM